MSAKVCIVEEGHSLFEIDVHQNIKQKHIYQCLNFFIQLNRERAITRSYPGSFEYYPDTMHEFQVMFPKYNHIFYMKDDDLLGYLSFQEVNLMNRFDRDGFGIPFDRCFVISAIAVKHHDENNSIGTVLLQSLYTYAAQIRVQHICVATLQHSAMKKFFEQEEFRPYQYLGKVIVPARDEEPKYLFSYKQPTMITESEISRLCSREYWYRNQHVLSRCDQKYIRSCSYLSCLTFPHFVVLCESAPGSNTMHIVRMHSEKSLDTKEDLMKHLHILTAYKPNIDWTVYLHAPAAMRFGLEDDDILVSYMYYNIQQSVL